VHSRNQRDAICQSDQAAIKLAATHCIELPTEENNMSAAPANISSTGADPAVTVTGGNLVRYTCHFYLWKPEGQVWPDTNTRDKLVHEVTLNKDHPPTDTFSLGPAPSLKNLALTWDIDMIVPGGGGPLQYSVSVKIKQGANEVMVPAWSAEGEINNVDATSGDTELRVTP
jgi:hypothetical protein